ncbi:MAG: endonuclease subunit [uncultured marine phage]|uniref:Endonuclease subunit n=1 Tax=uncultured marine phage TaxID=707152 RepID=A0A8D9CDF4_9VIRU|nr:MAG: endonuclease subunit [uncultured marine phage]
MLISEIGIRNFKSFGNNEQTLKLNTEKGDLILLVGQNGAGKSSLIESIDYTLFNKVKGKKKKWLTLNTLPNRINKELLTRIKFKSSGTDVEVIRGQNPSSLSLIENDIPNERAGKKNLDTQIQKYVGLDIETFKSFISMSINDFKNFINLSNEEKKLLLDKLFNLETINILNDILKSINKENKEQLNILDKEISTLEDSVLSIKRSVQKAKEKKQESLEGDIESIKESMLSKKEDYQKIQSKVTIIRDKDDQLNDAIEKEKSEFINIKSEIRQVDSQLALYDKGKCPTCETDLTTGDHVNIKDSFVSKKNKLEEVKAKLDEKLTYLKGKKSELNKISNEADNTFMDIKSTLRSMKREMEKLQTQQQNSDQSEDISEFLKTIEELETKKSISEETSSECKDRFLYHKELTKVFSESGVKKTIIQNILNPINHFISENLTKMGMPFEVTLDNTFSATIKNLGSEVDHESLSTGETKKVNIAIMIAYLKLIRTKRSINVLFLDEVFASIDVEGIYSILELLRHFANEYNINIFLVHHSILETEYFDRVIRLNKDIFSSVEEVDINEYEFD